MKLYANIGIVIRNKMILVDKKDTDYIFTEGDTHHVYITKGIGAPHTYLDLFELLRSAGDHEVINFYFNTPGGRVDTVCQLADAMENCLGTLNGHLVGQVASGGTVLAMYVDNMYVANNSYFMIHNFSGGAYGKGSDLVMSAQNSQDWVYALYRECYKDFLSNEEIENEILKNQDIYLNPVQILDRWERVISSRDAQVSEQVKAYEEEQKSKVKEALKDEIIKEYLASKKPKKQVAKGTKS